MTDKLENTAAFARSAAFGDGCHDWGQEGMSLRDYFAAAALQGFCAYRANGDEDFAPLECAEDSYIMADAMLKARETTND